MALVTCAMPQAQTAVFIRLIQLLQDLTQMIMEAHVLQLSAKVIQQVSEKSVMVSAMRSFAKKVFLETQFILSSRMVLRHLTLTMSLPTLIPITFVLVPSHVRTSGTLVEGKMRIYRREPGHIQSLSKMCVIIARNLLPHLRLHHLRHRRPQLPQLRVHRLRHPCQRRPQL
jgi:hypothetical protein